MIKIRKATREDFELISYLGQTTFKESFGDLFLPQELNEYLQATFNPLKIKESLLKENNFYSIVYFKQQPAGYFKLKRNSGLNGKEQQMQIQLQKIYVLKDYLDLGLGNTMMKEIFSFAKSRNCPLIWLVVLQSNTRALRYYVKHGFIIIKEHAYQIGSKNLKFHIMAKNLKTEESGKPYSFSPLTSQIDELKNRILKFNKDL